MNTKIWRHIFDAIEDYPFNHDTQIRVSRANISAFQEADMSKVETPGVDLYAQLAVSKNHEVAS